MKTINLSALLLAVVILAAPGSQAASVDFNFSATVSQVTDPNFATLLATGDPVSGMLRFSFSPPPVFNVSNPILGGYSTPAGPVSGMALSGTQAGNAAAAIDIRDGTGPMAPVGGFERMVNGLFVGMDINGFTASLNDYLALGASEFHLTLIGQTDFGGNGIASGGVARLQVRSASLTLSPVPDSGSTMSLLFASLAPLFLHRRRTTKNLTRIAPTTCPQPTGH